METPREWANTERATTASSISGTKAQMRSPVAPLIFQIVDGLWGR